MIPWAKVSSGSKVQIFRIDDAADFDRLDVHHNAAEAVSVDAKVFIDLGKLLRRYLIHAMAAPN